MSLALLKPKLLEAGTARLTGEITDFGRESHAGPGAGKSKSVFFSDGRTRIRLLVSDESDESDESPVEIHVFGKNPAGGFKAELIFEDFVVQGKIEEEGLHCPKQAYITVSEGCIFRCRFCNVPNQEKHIKSPEEVYRLVESVKDSVECISVTSGVIGSVEEDEERVLEVVKKLSSFNLPIGVSIYPSIKTPKKLFDLGVCEVKFNLETATDELFEEICRPSKGKNSPDRTDLIKALSDSVLIFGKNRVFSNVILGLGETDSEMESCIRMLCEMGVIPVIRPLTPSAELADYRRPSAERILKISAFLKEELIKAGLDTTKALTMCTRCTGCDLVPGRDL